MRYHLWAIHRGSPVSYFHPIHVWISTDWKRDSAASQGSWKVCICLTVETLILGWSDSRKGAKTCYKSPEALCGSLIADEPLLACAIIAIINCAIEVNYLLLFIIIVIYLFISVRRKQKRRHRHCCKIQTVASASQKTTKINVTCVAREYHQRKRRHSKLRTCQSASGRISESSTINLPILTFFFFKRALSVPITGQHCTRVLSCFLRERTVASWSVFYSNKYFQWGKHFRIPEKRENYARIIQF